MKPQLYKIQDAIRLDATLAFADKNAAARKRKRVIRVIISITIVALIVWSLI